MPRNTDGALRVDLTVRHPECWIIEVSAETEVDVLGRGVYRIDDRRANSHVTLTSDRRAAIDEAITVARASGHTLAVAEMGGESDYAVPIAPGKASRELLVTHDPTKQVSDAFTSRGFVYGAPVDIRDGVEHWTLFTHNDRQAIQTALDDIRDEAAATIELVGITAVDARADDGTLPLYRLSSRQREVFALAQRRGYYAHPKEVAASDLASELGVTPSTIHEHLHRAEAKLLDRS